MVHILFARKSVFLMGANFLSLALGFITILIISREMGAVPLGIIGFAFGFIGIFSGIQDLGFFTTHIKLVSEGKNFEKCMSTILFLKALQAIILAVCVIASIFAAKFFLGRFEGSQNEWAIYIILLSTIIDMFTNSITFTFQAKQEVAKMQIPLLLGAITRIISIGTVVVFSLGVFALVLSYIIGSIVQLIATVSIFKKIKLQKPDKGLVKEYVLFSLPLAAVGFLAGIQTNIDKVLIQFFYGTKEVGIYYGSQKLSDLFNVISGSIMVLLLPAISRFSQKKDKKAIADIVLKAEKYISMFLIPIMLFVIVFPKEVVTILGKDFEMGGMVFAIFAITAFANSIGRLFVAQLVGTTKQKTYLKFTIICFILTIVLDIILIPKEVFGIKVLGMGIVGAALATAIQTIVFTLLIKISARNEIPIKFTMAKHLVAGIAMIVVLIVLNRFVEINLLTIAPMAIFGAFVYFAVLGLVLNGFSKKDFDFLFSSFNPKRMAEYVGKELGEK